MDSIQIYLITAAIFFLGGAVKGTVGFGLPLVSITLLTPFYGLVDAIGLMVIPAV
ncbi:MAG: sulfite exporter TauE/SafE family protein, partial [Proteobacteria bacterium]|nr:sulfite exporter TauE/SafE family protein [Pseudomonadota bacterium]